MEVFIFRSFGRVLGIIKISFNFVFVIFFRFMGLRVFVSKFLLIGVFGNNILSYLLVFGFLNLMIFFYC